MHKPEPSAFGLTVGESDRCRRMDSFLAKEWLFLVRVPVAASLGFFGLGFATADDGWAFVGLWGGGFLALTDVWEQGERALAGALFPSLGKYREFQHAVEAYEGDLKHRQEQERQAREQECRRRVEFWRSLTGHAFERELASLFERAGYKVRRTPGSGDGGIDLVLQQGGKTTIVQCKQTKGPVGPSVARDLFGTFMHAGADYGVLAVTGGVTSGVHSFFFGKNLRVMDITQILALQEATGR
jgi:hypothetical protein